MCIRDQNTAHGPPWKLLAAVLEPLAGGDCVLLFFDPRLVGKLDVPEGARLEKQRVKRRMEKNLSEAPLPFEEPLTQLAAVHRLHRTIPNRAAATRLYCNRLPPRLGTTRRTEARDPRRSGSDSDCRMDPPSPVDRPTGRTIGRVPRMPHRRVESGTRDGGVRPKTRTRPDNPPGWLACTDPR